MPTYEYKCKTCEREFEFQQRISEDPLKDCPFDDCNGEVFRKISKNIGLVFNGSGFYLTDYVHKNGNNKNGSSGKAPAKDTAKPKETAKTSS